ncbi:MAG: hypothetical protein PVH40_05990, partial [Gemmatimonadales bacterium]
MALRGASKLALTPYQRPDQASSVRRASSVLLAAAAVAAGPVGAQAPAAAELWRVAASAIASPHALQVGATSSFWNPGSPNGQRHGAAGIEIVHTSDVLGLSGLLAGGSLPVAGPVRVGIALGRMQVRDLVRTTTTPDSEEGTIPVYEQFAGAHLAIQTAAFQVGALVSVHDARFDIESESGATLDFGFRAHPIHRLTIAAATHLLPITFASEPTTDYFFGAEYVVLDRWRLSSLDTRLAVQYGATYRNSGDLDHTVSSSFTINEHVLIDVALTNESAYGQRQWRPGLAIGLRLG